MCVTHVSRVFLSKEAGKTLTESESETENETGNELDTNWMKLDWI